MDLDGKTILITGGAGMIGSATVDLLLRDHPRTRIVILDNLSRGTTANIESALKPQGPLRARGHLRCGDRRERMPERRRGDPSGGAAHHRVPPIPGARWR